MPNTKKGQQGKGSDTSKRGFASMEQGKQKEIASKGGKASQESGGRKGGSSNGGNRGGNQGGKKV